MSRPAGLRTLLAPLAHERRAIALVALALLAMGFAQASFLALIQGFAKALFADPAVTGGAPVPLSELFPPRAAAWLPELSVTSITRATLAVAVPLAIVFAGVLNSAANFIYQLNQQTLSLALAKSFRERVFHAILAQPYAVIRGRAVGEWMSLVMNDALFLQARFSEVMTGGIRAGVTVVFGVGAMLWIHPPTGLVLLAIAPFAAFAMGRTGRRIALFAEAYQRELGRLAALVLDFRARFDFIRSQGGEERERDAFSRVNRAYFTMVRRSILTRSAFAPLLEFAGFALFALVVWGVGRGHWAVGINAGTMLQFFAALGLLLKPLKEIGEQLVRYQETRGALKRSVDMLVALESASCSAPRPFSVSAIKKPFAALEIQTLSAGFTPTPAFAASSLSIAPGQSIAIIGPSGAGKSTFAKTLAGLVDPLAWNASLPWPEATAQVSMVSQDPFLFDATVADNLAYGLDNPPTPAALAAALAAVNLEAELKTWPKGLDTHLRALGGSVSGGQLQRLCIARGLLRERPILLLDEATAAVDPRSEREITERLIAAARAAKTALVAVTHRLRWLAAYDEVWFVEGGKLALRGPHATLLTDARYRRFCEAATDGAP